MQSADDDRSRLGGLPKREKASERCCREQAETDSLVVAGDAETAVHGNLLCDSSGC
jgi:hypothetical protein